MPGCCDWHLLPALGPTAASPTCYQRVAGNVFYDTLLLALCRVEIKSGREWEAETQQGRECWHVGCSRTAGGTEARDLTWQLHLAGAEPSQGADKPPGAGGSANKRRERLQLGQRPQRS